MKYIAQRSLRITRSKSSILYSDWIQDVDRSGQSNSVLIYEDFSGVPRVLSVYRILSGDLTAGYVSVYNLDAILKTQAPRKVPGSVPRRPAYDDGRPNETIDGLLSGRHGDSARHGRSLCRDPRYPAHSNAGAPYGTVTSSTEAGRCRCARTWGPTGSPR